MSAPNYTPGQETDYFYPSEDIARDSEGGYILAMAEPYIRTSTGLAIVKTKEGLNSDWAKSNVVFYYKNFETVGFNATNRLATTIHEVGHTLKMAHPSDIDTACRYKLPPTGRTSVMVQGAKTWGVQEFDTEEMIIKWGKKQ